VSNGFATVVGKHRGVICCRRPVWVHGGRQPLPLPYGMRSGHPKVVSASIATVAAGEGISAISTATACAAARASLSLSRS
jgi:hypothetical protein